MCNVLAREIDSGLELIDVAKLSDAIKAAGIACECLADAGEIERFIMQEIGRNDIVLVMSNGSFGGLSQKLEDYFKVR